MSQPNASLRRSLIVGLVGFLTLVDLFAAQAILPSLARHYGVAPGAMGFAVNASTFGMAAAGLGVALFGRTLRRRRAIWLCLFLLSLPTAALAHAPDLTAFLALRVVQGLLMAAAFTLTLAYFAEQCSPEDTAQALAAYVTGVVASNLFGRLASASVADMAGLPANFYLFAVLNLGGALIVWRSFADMAPKPAPASLSPVRASFEHLSDPALRSAFAIGFLILFAFVGTFTYINFVLVREPLSLAPMSLGLITLVFLPSMATTPFASRLALRYGTPATTRVAAFVALAGLPLLILPSLTAVVLGLALVGVGTFLAQAIATGFVGRTAMREKGAASGLYLASYYTGGLAGAGLLGLLFDRHGWAACVAGIGLALAATALLAGGLKSSTTSRNSVPLLAR